MPGLPALGPRGEGWVAIQSVILFWIVATGWWFPVGVASSLPPAIVAIGAALMAAGLILVAAGILALASHDAFTALPRPRDSARLVETGVFGLVRNPVYGGLILTGLGWAIVRGSAAALIGDVVLFLFFDLKRRREEAWLVERFPGYVAYRSRTRRLIPWVY
jgi:protein-S-isoprenylcysteine O-methyltransferase Ste14